MRPLVVLLLCLSTKKLRTEQNKRLTIHIIMRNDI